MILPPQDNDWFLVGHIPFLRSRDQIAKTRFRHTRFRDFRHIHACTLIIKRVVQPKVGSHSMYEHPVVGGHVLVVQRVGTVLYEGDELVLQLQQVHAVLALSQLLKKEVV